MYTATTSKSPGIIYILQSSIPAGNARHSAEYYIGWTTFDGLKNRLEMHQAGRGASLTRYWSEIGAQMSVVALIEGDRLVERYLKNRKSAKRVLAAAAANRLPFNVLYLKK